MQRLGIYDLTVQSVISEVFESELSFIIGNREVLSKVADDLRTVGLVKSLFVLLLQRQEKVVYVVNQLSGSLFCEHLGNLLVNLVESLKVHLSLLFLLINQVYFLLEFLLEFLV